MVFRHNAMTMVFFRCPCSLFSIQSLFICIHKSGLCFGYEIAHFEIAHWAGGIVGGALLARVAPGEGQDSQVAVLRGCWFGP